MVKAFKYRLYPNVNQTRELEIALETHRHLWNQCLEIRKTAYETAKKQVSFFDQCKWFTTAKISNPWFSKLNYSTARDTMHRLSLAFSGFFRRVKAGQKPGYPRFKGKGQISSITYSGGSGAKLIGNKLRLQHIGLVRVNLHRPIEGTPKTITIKREASKWFVTICCDLGDLHPISKNTEAVGIDMGLESFLTTSDGQRVEPLQPLKWKLRKLRVQQRTLARRCKGSKSRAIARKAVASTYYKISNYRRDAHHKIARKLVDTHGLIAVERLDVKNMQRNHRAARAIQDSGWGQFLGILKGKAAYAGVKVVEVDPRYTSQTCPRCGAIAKKLLSQRLHSCPCGYRTHRDIAAAQVILARAQDGMRPGGRNVSDSLHGLRSHSTARSA
jgi:putative transposase